MSNPSEETEIKRFMCIRVLENGETERATHFLVVDANDYDELANRRTVVYKDGTHKVVNGPTYEYENDPDWLVTV
jgi:hypothetical protein